MRANPAHAARKAIVTLAHAIKHHISRLFAPSNDGRRPLTRRIDIHSETGMGLVTAFPRSDKTAIAEKLLQRILDTGHLEQVDGASGDVLVSVPLEMWRFEQLCLIGADVE